MTRLPPDPEVVALQRAQVLCELRRFSEAIAALQGIVAADPAGSRAWMLLAQAHLGMGEHQTALDAAQTAIALNPHSEWPFQLASAALRGLGRDDEAADFARRAVALAPQNWAVHAQLAQSLAKTPDGLAEARRAADRAVALAPETAGAHMAAGAVAAAAGDRQTAGEAFRRVLTIDPQNAVAQHEFARMQLRKGRYRNANPTRLSTAASGFAGALGADPRLEQSRRALQAVIRTFLGYTAYFIFVVGVVAGRLGVHSTPTARRIVTIVLLALPVWFALRFLVQATPPVRSYVRQTLTSGRTGVAAVAEAIAVATLVLSCIITNSDQSTLVTLAIVFALLGRVALWSARPRVHR